MLATLFFSIVFLQLNFNKDKSTSQPFSVAGCSCSFALFRNELYLFIGGWKMMISWIVSGISFDLIHGIGNAVAMLALFRPLNAALNSVAKKYQTA